MHAGLPRIGRDAGGDAVVSRAFFFASATDAARMHTCTRAHTSSPPSLYPIRVHTNVRTMLMPVAVGW